MNIRDSVVSIDCSVMHAAPHFFYGGPFSGGIVADYGDKGSLQMTRRDLRNAYYSLCLRLHEWRKRLAFFDGHILHVLFPRTRGLRKKTLVVWVGAELKQSWLVASRFARFWRSSLGKLGRTSSPFPHRPLSWKSDLMSQNKYQTDYSLAIPLVFVFLSLMLVARWQMLPWLKRGNLRVLVGNRVTYIQDSPIDCIEFFWICLWTDLIHFVYIFVKFVRLNQQKKTTSILMKIWYLFLSCQNGFRRLLGLHRIFGFRAESSHWITNIF